MNWECTTFWIKRFILLQTICVVVAITVACGSNSGLTTPAGLSSISNLPNEVIKIIENNYVEPERVVREEVNQNAVRGFLTSLSKQYPKITAETATLQFYINLLGDDYTSAKPGNLVKKLYQLVFEQNPDLAEFITDSTELAVDVAKEIVTGLNDPYSGYLTPATVKRFAESLTGKYQGIGAYVNVNQQGLVYISSFLSDSPASEAGLLANDAFLAVDDEIVSGLNLTDVISLIRGPADTEVKLTIRRINDSGSQVELSFIVTRRAIVNEVVTTNLIETSNRRFGVLEITAFNEITKDLVLNALCRLVADERCADYCSTNNCGAGNLDGLILDLRNNRGGLLNATIDTTSIFIDANGTPALFQRTSDGKFSKSNINGNVKYTGIPLIVLVSEASASGAEVLTGALRDHGRAWVSGTTTFGKGSVNSQFNLSNGAAVYLTIRRWYTPCGELIEGAGILPQFEYNTPEDAAQIFMGNDPTPLCNSFNTPNK